MKRTGIKRTKPMPTTNAKRKAKRKAEGETYGPFFEYVKTLPCAVMGEGDECFGPVTGHHLKSVGAGGKDAGNLCSLCTKHHREIHDIGPKRFDSKYLNDLKLYGSILWDRYQQGERE